MVAQSSSFVTNRFAEVGFDDDDVIEFPWGIPGFASLKRFLALSLPERPNFIWLQSLEDPSVALPTADPWQAFPDYRPQLPSYAAAALNLQQPDDFAILCVIVTDSDTGEIAMNLLAPIVVNVKTWRARQVVLENSGYSVCEAVPKSKTAETALPT